VLSGDIDTQLGVDPNEGILDEPGKCLYFLRSPALHPKGEMFYNPFTILPTHPVSSQSIIHSTPHLLAYPTCNSLSPTPH